MGWSYRKSFGSGPFRVNFSKSGISYSVGVKGARINVGPRGTYVNLSAHGISYRRKVSGTAVLSPDFMPQPVPFTVEEVHNIASADIGQLTDTDSKEFITELTQKAGQVSYVKWFGVFPLIVFLGTLFFTWFDSRTVMIRPATDSVLVRVTSDVGVNIRTAAAAKSPVLRSAILGETFVLLDSTGSKWLKVGFKDSAGYIASRFAAIEQVHHDPVSGDETFLANPYAVYLFAGGIAGFIILITRLKKVDKRRFAMELHYDMDEQFRHVYQQFGEHFTGFSRSARIWQYVNARQVNDYKRNAGAGKLINRLALRGISGNQVPLPHFITNVSIPYLKLSNLELYFLPERLLVKRGGTFAAVFYKNLCVTGFTTRFIEDESVPHDARVIDQIWRYLNKSGGPDRRFNNNRQLPICAYSEYTLCSDTGIYEVITTSKQGAMDGFASFLTQIGDLQSRISIG